MQEPQLDSFFVGGSKYVKRERITKKWSRIVIQEDRLRDLYLEQKLSTYAIAKQVGVSQPVVQYNLVRYGIPTRHGWKGYNRGRRKLPPDETIKRLYVEEQLSCKQIATRYGLAEGTSTLRILRRLGVTIRPQKGEGSRHSKRNHSRFRKGYPLVYAPKHSKADEHGYVMEHVLAIEKSMGRTLSNSQVVHHIDFDKANNSPDNLHVCTRNKHSNLHWQINHLAKQLINKGIIKFSQEKGYYLSM